MMALADRYADRYDPDDSRLREITNEILSPAPVDAHRDQVVADAVVLVERWDNGDFRTGPVGTALMGKLASSVAALYCAEREN